MATSTLVHAADLPVSLRWYADVLGRAPDKIPGKDLGFCLEDSEYSFSPSKARRPRRSCWSNR